MEKDDIPPHLQTEKPAVTIIGELSKGKCTCEGWKMPHPQLHEPDCVALKDYARWYEWYKSQKEGSSMP